MNDTLDSKKLWKLSIKELRSVCQPKEKLQSTDDTWFTRLVSRRFSIYFTKLFLLLNVSPNQITVLMIIFGIIGSILFSFPSIVLACLAFISFQIWTYLDCSDGEVARITKKTSLLGPYLDRVNHYIADILIFLSLGIKAYIISDDMLFIILGFILSILIIFSRLGFHLLNNLLMEYKVYESERNIIKDNIETSDVKRINLISRVVNLAARIPIRRIFTGTIEVSIVFLIISIFYHIFALENIIVITLYVYIAGNLLNVFFRFLFIFLNFDKLVKQAFDEGIHV